MYSKWKPDCKPHADQDRIVCILSRLGIVPVRVLAYTHQK